MDSIKKITFDDVSSACSIAKSSTKARSAILINKTFEEVPQRFVNCLTKFTYVRPHKHTMPDQWELMSWLSGEIVSLVFNQSGDVLDKLYLAEFDSRIIEFPPNKVHTFYTLSVGSYLEIRNCAYQPNIDRHYMSWAPEENSEKSGIFLETLKSLEVGDNVQEVYECQIKEKKQNTKDFLHSF